MSMFLLNTKNYDDLIDVRSPTEYVHDHITGAINLPVLNDAQRHEIGLLYKHSPFEARRRGAAVIAANIADLLAGPLAERDRNWRSLTYCWRGGMRSSALVHVLRQIGWSAEVLIGGYKSYRSSILNFLVERPRQLSFVVLAGPTGAGKTAILAALASLEVQTLDLEQIANHRGSLFGSLGSQPSQKMFESLLAARLADLDPTRPVVVEAESNMIGRVLLPPELQRAMRAGRLALIETSRAIRASRIAEEYTLFADPELFAEVLAKMARYTSKKLLLRWQLLHERGCYVALAASLLEHYYDPKYRHSISQHYCLADAVLRIRGSANDRADDLAQAQKIAVALS